jgi:hypothetical protein
VTFKPGIATAIDRWIVLSAIDFNDESLFNTSKVGDERTDGVLPSEPPTGQLAPTKVPPQLLFRVGHTGA